MRRSAAALLLLALSQEDLQKRRDALAPRLEELRGLAFKTPLPIREGTRKEYAVFVLENARRVYGEDLPAAERGLKALGLLPPKLRLEVALTAQAGIGVKAWCSHGELRLLDRSADGEWLVSKMDLGLIDQHFAPAAPATFDARMALAALRMGDAEVAKLLFRHGGKLPGDLAKQVTEETAAWEREGSRLASAVVPRIFVRTADFPWRRGAVFALSLHASGGVAALDKAFASPPVSTRQILHPDLYAKGVLPATLDLGGTLDLLRGKGYRAVYQTVMGELGCGLVLETHFPAEELAAASAGWSGDSLAVLEKEEGLPLVAWATEWETEDAATAFQALAQKLGLKLASADPSLLAPVVRRKTSVVFLLNVPKDLKDVLLESAWGSKRTRGKTVDTLGE
jgi:hypothetical protein